MVAIYEPKGRAREYAELACNLWLTCSHQCAYCYCPGILHIKPEDFHIVAPPRAGVLEALREQLAKDADKVRPEFIRGSRRVCLSFIGDCYQPHEEGFTRLALEILVENNVRFTVLTKGGMRAARDFDLYADGMGTFGTTLCFTVEAGGLGRKWWEPSSASIEDRKIAIEEAHQRGIHTWLSIEPVIDTAQALTLIRTMFPLVDEFRVGKLSYHPHAATIDWRAFALDVRDALEQTGKPYIIKKDLAAYLPDREAYGDQTTDNSNDACP